MPVPVNILEPVEGWRYPGYFADLPADAVAPEGALPFGPVTASFGVSGGAGKVRWSYDEEEIGSTSYSGQMSIQFTMWLRPGRHTFTVETESTKETVSFLIG